MGNTIKIYHGDCLEEYKKIKPGSVDLVLTDPPYGIIKGLGSGTYDSERDREWDVVIPYKLLLKTAKEILRPNGRLILFSKEPYTSKLITNASSHPLSIFTFNHKMIWVKGHFTNYLSVKKTPANYYEEIIVFTKILHPRDVKNPIPTTFNLWEGKKHKSNILQYCKESNYLHPSQKPINLLQDLIKTFSNPGDLITDLTMGSGSTGVACFNADRDFIGIEKDEGYFKIAQERINRLLEGDQLFKSYSLNG